MPTITTLDTDRLRLRPFVEPDLDALRRRLAADAARAATIIGDRLARP